MTRLARHQMITCSKHARDNVDRMMRLTGCRVLLQVAGYMRLLVPLGAPSSLLLSSYRE